jgi:hypothetical protein
MRKATGFLALLTILSVASAYAGSSSAEMRVSVQVIARTLLTVDQEPASLQITADDVARGYVEVPHAVAVRIRSNASNGYSVQFQPVGYPFSKAEVTWGTSVAIVGGDGSWLTQPYQGGTTTGTLNVRLTLASSTTPGTYAWPIRIAADSL